MWLIVGVISGAWAWSSKSLNSWKLLANRFNISNFHKISRSWIKVLWFLDWIQKTWHACLSYCCLSGNLELSQNYSHLNFFPQSRQHLELTMVVYKEELWTAILQRPGWFLAVPIPTGLSYKLPSQTYRILCSNQNKPVTLWHCENKWWHFKASLKWTVLPWTRDSQQTGLTHAE